MARFTLVPRDTKFNTLLVSMGDVAARTAVALQQMLNGYPSTRHMVGEIKALESQGDKYMRSMVRELLATFVTPIDREDLYELASALDDIIDHIDEGTSMFDIYQVESVTDCVRKQSDVLVGATAELLAALHQMDDPVALAPHLDRIHDLEDAGDALMREGVKEVFQACYDEPAIIICWKDIYETFEDAMDSIEKAAIVLESVGVKNS